jgi:hypothetical protein
LLSAKNTKFNTTIQEIEVELRGVLAWSTFKINYDQHTPTL